MKKFLVNGFILTATALILRTIGMFFSIYISKKIGSESIGVFELVMSVYLFFVTFALSGINLACTRLVSEELAYGNNESLKFLVKKCLMFSFAFGSISCIFLFVFAPYISNNFLHNKVSCFPLYVIAFSLPFVSMSSCINGYFSAIKQVKKNAFVQIIEQIVQIIIICFIFNFLNPHSVDFAIITLVIGTTVSEACSFFLLFILYRLNIKKMQNTRNNSTITFVKQILRISLPVAVTSYVRSGLSTIKHLLIPIKLEASGISCSEALSQYGMINGMVFPLILFPNILIISFSELLIPEFSYCRAKNESIKLTKMLNLIFKYSFIFSFCMVGIFLCFSDSFSILFYNKIEISQYIKTICPLIVLMYVDNIVDGILKGLDKQVSVMGINILDLVTCITLICFLLPIQGMSGYIAIIFVSEILNFTLSLGKLLKSTNLKINYTSWIFIPILSLILTYLIEKSCINTFIIQIPNLIICVILFVLLYVFFIYLLHLLLVRKN